MPKIKTGKTSVDEETGEVFDEVTLTDSGVDTSDIDSVRSGMGVTDLTVVDNRNLPAPPDANHLVHFDAVVINEGDSFDDIMRKMSIFTSYYEVPSEPLEKFVGTKISIIGCAMHPGATYKSKETNEYVTGDPFALLKLSEIVTDRASGAERNMIVRTTSKNVMNLARFLWLPHLGWFDWPGSAEYLVHRDNRGIHLQELTHRNTTTS